MKKLVKTLVICFICTTLAQGQSAKVINFLSHCLSEQHTCSKKTSSALISIQKCYQTRDISKLKAHAAEAKEKIQEAANLAKKAFRAAENASKKSLTSCDSVQKLSTEARLHFQHATIKFSNAFEELYFLSAEDNFTYINTHLQEALDFIKDGARLMEMGSDKIHLAIQWVEKSCK